MDLLRWTFDHYGFSHWGHTALTTPLSLDIYKNWLDKNYHGDMKYLQDHIPQKEHPQLLLPRAQSALVMTIPYGLSVNTLPTPHLKIASYAQGMDYHLWLKNRVTQVCRDLKSLFPEHEFVAFTDSSPVLERDLAFRAGLGWIGKNTCLIDRKEGSLFFLAEIYTTLPATQDTPRVSPDHCGTCRRCIEACPTEALEDDKTLNATKCISYWTIESRGIPPTALRENFAGWFFGCDICQTVCPWNIKLRDFTHTAPSQDDLARDLEIILSHSNNKLLQLFHGTPLVRAGGRGLKRNALIVIANLRLHTLEPLVTPYIDDPKLGELAQWTLQCLKSRPSS